LAKPPTFADENSGRSLAGHHVTHARRIGWHELETAT
jgi:hypothetical protein